jgi:triacylglycerol lipase
LILESKHADASFTLALFWPSTLLLVPAALCAHGTVAQVPPIVFRARQRRHGRAVADHVWRFESNGWPRTRLHAIDMPYPLARDDDGKAQPGRSSTAEHMAYLKAEVDKVLRPPAPTRWC